jgi:hypothetical protein
VRIIGGEHGEASLAQRRIWYRANLLEVHRDCRPATHDHLLLLRQGRWDMR